MLTGQAAAHFDARTVHCLAVDDAVGASQVDILEDTASGFFFGKAVAAQAVFVDCDEFTRLDFADERSTHNVERSGFGCHNPAAVDFAKCQRTHTVTVARGIQGVFVHEDEAESTLDLRQEAQRCIRQVVGVRGCEQFGDERCVRR